MGLFSFLKSVNDAVFDGMKENTIKKVQKQAAKQSKNDPAAKLRRKLERERKQMEGLTKRTKKTSLSKKEEKELYIKKYGDDFANAILNKKLLIGMNYEMVKKIKGKEKKKVENVSRGKEITKLYYDAYKNRQKNISYKFEITLKEGKVNGWKEL